MLSKAWPKLWILLAILHLWRPYLSSAPDWIVVIFKLRAAVDIEISACLLFLLWECVETEYLLQPSSSRGNLKLTDCVLQMKPSALHIVLFLICWLPNSCYHIAVSLSTAASGSRAVPSATMAAPDDLQHLFAPIKPSKLQPQYLPSPLMLTCHGGLYVWWVKMINFNQHFLLCARELYCVFDCNSWFLCSWS